MSFSFDASLMMTYAADIFNGLSPAIIVVVGLSMGIMLVLGVISLVETITYRIRLGGVRRGRYDPSTKKWS